jgi:hypothetical protein
MLLRLRLRLATLNLEHQSLQRESHRLVRRLAKVEHVSRRTANSRCRLMPQFHRVYP